MSAVKSLAYVVSTIILACVNFPALAQTYPTKPIRMIVPFAPGGGTDLVARAVGQRISGGLGVPVIVDNRPGASANIGNELVAKAIPDGYTILMTSSSVTINPSLFKHLGYDPIRDFSPISNATFVPYVLVVHPSLGVSTLEELVQVARTRKGQLTYGSAGTGNATHLGMELLKHVAKIDIVHVPYKGTGQAINELLGAHIQLIWATIPPAIPHIKSGRLKALAVGSPKRARALPEVATTEELGFRGVEAASWFGMLAPAKTPRPIITRLNKEVIVALSSPEFAEQLSAEGAEPAGTTPEEFTAFIKAQVEKWREVVKIAGVQPQ